MIPTTETDIEDYLKCSFEERYRRKDVNLTGILLARPESKVTQEQILPHLNFWHYRSDYYTEFFCIGYSPNPPQEAPDAKPVTSLDSKPWYFSHRAYVELLEDIEDQLGRRIPLECAFVLLNARYDAVGKSVSLDFEGAMIVDIEFAVKQEAIRSATWLADEIFAFAKRVNEDVNSPVFEFSDSLGIHVVKGTLKDWFLSLLPDHVSKGAQKALHFVSHDLKKTA